MNREVVVTLLETTRRREHGAEAHDDLTRCGAVVRVAECPGCATPQADWRERNRIGDGTTCVSPNADRPERLHVECLVVLVDGRRRRRVPDVTHASMFPETPPKFPERRPAYGSFAHFPC